MTEEIPETLHLTIGSELPPKQKGLLRLYSMKFCPYAERVRIVLRAKGIPHEIVNINLKDKPEWLFELNALGKVPILDIENKIITESLDISDYLDEIYPENPLYPKDAKGKERDQALIKKFDQITAVFYQMSWKPKEKPLEEYVKILLPLLQEFESELAKRGNFFGGSKPGMVDYMIWPWAERSGILDIVHGQKIPIPENEIKRIRAWCARMQTLKEIKETITSVDRLHKLGVLYLQGKTVDYDTV